MIGTKIKFPDGNNILFQQDFCSFNGISPFVEFTVEKRLSENSDYYWLVGEGYGESANYGDGSVAVHKDDLPKHLFPSFDIKQAFKELFDKADGIKHWHDTMYNKETGECDGVVVSKTHQAELTETINKYRDFRDTL